MIDSWNSAVLNQGQHVKLSEALNALNDRLNTGTGKNLNSYPYYQGTRTDQNVTWTDNGDGTITATGTVAPGANSNFTCHNRVSGRTNELVVPNGRYILSGLPDGASLDKYWISAEVTKSGSAVTLGRLYDQKGIVLNLDGDDYSTTQTTLQISLHVAKGFIIGSDNSVIFKPMLLKYPNSDLSWEPWIPSSYNQVATLSAIECKKTTAGNYILQATVDSEGAVTYSWEEVAP